MCQIDALPMALGNNLLWNQANQIRGLILLLHYGPYVLLFQQRPTLLRKLTAFMEVMPSYVPYDISRYCSPRQLPPSCVTTIERLCIMESLL